MLAQGTILQTKLQPPRLSPRTLHRPRLADRLAAAPAYRLTLLQAGAGYGKSTLLAELADRAANLVWCHLDEDDVDPFIFLLYLLHAFAGRRPELAAASLALLEAQDSATGTSWPAVVDSLINQLAAAGDEPLLLVLDDAHRLNQNGISLQILDRLIAHAPAALHVVLAARHPPQLPGLVRWRAQGQVLLLTEAELAFTPAEIATLFREQYGRALDAAEVAALVRETEGWAIALPLLGQAGLWSEASGRGRAAAAGKADLFAFLTQEVLARQPPPIQAFLRATAGLRQLTPALCDALRDANDSAELLDYLRQRGLFLVDLADGQSRYHHLFRRFLYEQLAPAEREGAHLKIAPLLQGDGETEEAIYHYFQAAALSEAAALLATTGRSLVRAGRLDTLAGWLAQLPPAVLAEWPPLLVCLGDIARLRSRFDEALGWYEQAEARCRGRGDVQGVAQALRGQARVYLDTVNPSQAERPLREALRLADGQADREAHASLLELLAENQLNLGHAAAARELQMEARQLREEGPAEAELAVRVLLRTGRLDHARQLLAERARAEEEAPVLRPRAHRETLLLLSLILAFQGDTAAYEQAVAGIERGRQLNSPFVTAVGFMRQGHAWLLRAAAADRYERAHECFAEAIRISEELSVARLRVEAYWGLCRVYAHQGHLADAETAAAAGIAIAQPAGDEWISAHIRVALGGAYILAGQPAAAATWLSSARQGFRECGDLYGEALAMMWQCLGWYDAGDEARLDRGLADLLRLVTVNGYQYLLTRRTLAGPPEPRRLVPLLLRARDRGIESAGAQGMLAQLGLSQLETHPGYQLRLQALGRFQVWRGLELLDESVWSREKARQLLLLFITYRNSFLEREQIFDWLWPDRDVNAAGRSFKVALNALYQVLEPTRTSGAPSAYIQRAGTRYRLRLDADIWLDAAEFERALEQNRPALLRGDAAAIRAYQAALNLYQGDFLAAFVYEAWCQDERLRLRQLYLQEAERLAGVLIGQEHFGEAVSVSQAILQQDPCWESASRQLMISYSHLGNRPQALRVYHELVDRLRQELDTAPSAATTTLFEQLLKDKLPLPIFRRGR